jgi:hypothetical protein
MDADPYTNRRVKCPLCVPPLDSAEEIGRKRKGACRIIRLWLWHPEHNQRSITDELIDETAMALC